MVEPGQEASRPSTHASIHRKETHRLKQLLAEKTLDCLSKSRPDPLSILANHVGVDCLRDRRAICVT
jgi:hypothetical protein